MRHSEQRVGQPLGHRIDADDRGVRNMPRMNVSVMNVSSHGPVDDREVDAEAGELAQALPPEVVEADAQLREHLVRVARGRPVRDHAGTAVVAATSSTSPYPSHSTTHVDAPPPAR